MSSIDLRDALKHAASALKAHGPEFALARSNALWANGGPEPVHDDDFAALLPAARAVRERVDWKRVRTETAGSDFAVAFLVLIDLMGITA